MCEGPEARKEGKIVEAVVYEIKGTRGAGAF